MRSSTTNIRRTRAAVLATLLAVGTVAGCGGGDSDDSTADSSSSDDTVATAEVPAGFATVSVEAADAVLDDPPEDLVVLDVRTAEEFGSGHLDGAVMLDFYRDDFQEQLSTLDPDVPYLVYCRSGNRSGQTLAMMQQLDFASAVDIDGGVVAWEQAGLPLVR